MENERVQKAEKRRGKKVGQVEKKENKELEGWRLE